MKLTIEDSLTSYLRYRLSINAGYISSHEMESARDWIRAEYNKQHTVDSISRAWRLLREKGIVKVREEKIPGRKQMTWKILEVRGNHKLVLS